jgi:hypothetical protein
MGRISITGAMATIVVATLAVTASAQQRPDARAMTCHQVQSLIANNGAVVITTGRHTYDRYVSGQSYCSIPYVTRPHTITTSDGACTVLRCGEPLFDRFRRF